MRTLYKEVESPKHLLRLFSDYVRYNANWVNDFSKDYGIEKYDLPVPPLTWDGFQFYLIAFGYAVNILHTKKIISEYPEYLLVLRQIRDEIHEDKEKKCSSDGIYVHSNYTEDYYESL